MSSSTTITSFPFLFKDNDTYLSQSNWQGFFSTALPSGFFSHACIYSDYGSPQVNLRNGEALLNGLKFTLTNGGVWYEEPDSGHDLLVAVVQTASSIDLIAFHDLTDGSEAAYKLFLCRILYQIADDPTQVGDVLNTYYNIGYETVLPIFYAVGGAGFWDLSRLVKKPGEVTLVTILAKDTGVTPIVNPPYCGHLEQYGLAQIYGGHKYSITIDNTYSQSEYILYPVPCLNMETAAVYITNNSGGVITIKIPKAYRGLSFEYVHDGVWVDGTDDISFLIPDEGDVIINFSQTYQRGATIPISGYEITQNLKNDDPGEGYTKAEANALFETQAAAEAALALKADAADFGELASQDTVDYETQVTNKPTLGTMAAEDDAPSDDKFYARTNGTWSDAWSDGLVTEDDLAQDLQAKADSVAIADEYNAGSTYTVGDIVMHDGKLYKDTEDWEEITPTEIVATGNVIRYNAYYTDPNHYYLYRGLVAATVSASTAQEAINTMLSNNYITGVTTQNYNPFGTYVAGQFLRLPNGTFVQLNGSSGKFTQITVEELIPDISDFEESPALTGTPTAPTAAKATDSTQIATTAFVHDVAEDYAPLASPALSGNPTAPTQSASDDSTKIATTAFVHDAIEADTSGLAPLASPFFTGTPVAPKPDASDDSYKIATTNFVKEITSGKADASDVYTKAEVDRMIESVPVAENYYTKTEANARFANLNSPTFSGSPKAPTAANGTNTTQIASTAFVQNAIANKANLNSPAFIGSPTAPTANESDNSNRIATTAFVHNAITVSEIDLYVDWSNGNDSTGDGSQSAPFKTIQKAIDSVRAGAFAMIHIAPAVYDETITISGKNIRMIGTTNTEIRVSSINSAKAAVTVEHGGNLEMVGVFSIYGENTALSIGENSSACYKIIESGDKLSVRARGTTQNVVHRCISVNYGGKFTANGEVDIYIYPNSVVSHGIYATYGGFVSVDTLDADIYSNDVALLNDKSFTIIGELTGTYGTAYSNTLGYCKIGNVN